MKKKDVKDVKKAGKKRDEIALETARQLRALGERVTVLERRLDDLVILGDVKEEKPNASQSPDTQV